MQKLMVVLCSKIYQVFFFFFFFGAVFCSIGLSPDDWGRNARTPYFILRAGNESRAKHVGCEFVPTCSSCQVHTVLVMQLWIGLDETHANSCNLCLIFELSSVASRECAVS